MLSTGRAQTLTAQWLNTVGLLLGMAGVVILFIWGPPRPDLDEGVKLSLDLGTVLRDGTRVSDMEEATKRLKRRHEIMSRIGLGLVGSSTRHHAGATRRIIRRHAATAASPILSTIAGRAPVMAGSLTGGKPAIRQG